VQLLRHYHCLRWLLRRATDVISALIKSKPTTEAKHLELTIIIIITASVSEHFICWSVSSRLSGYRRILLHGVLITVRKVFAERQQLQQQDGFRRGSSYGILDCGSAGRDRSNNCMMNL